MSIWQAILLGCIQGLSEFLPISSSGHLVLGHSLLGWQEANLFFDVLLHLATLLAILAFFKKDLLKLSIQEISLIVVGSVPVAAAGLMFRNQIGSAFTSVKIVAAMLIITGLLNLYTDQKLANGGEKSSSKNVKMNWQNAFIIGIFQALALAPGISRSGSTLAGGINQKLTRQKAFKFSFYLAIPAIIGAGLLQFLDLYQNGWNQQPWGSYLLGALAAFFTGLISLRVFRYVINQAKMEWFGWYCLLLGVGVLIFSLI